MTLVEKFLTIAENTEKFYGKDILINTSDDAWQRDFLEEFVQSVNENLVPINKIRNDGLAIKELIEKYLGFED